MKRTSFPVTSEMAGAALARLLRERLDLSWRESKRLVTTGKVHVRDRLVTNPWRTMEHGELISVDPDRRRPGRRPTLQEDRVIFSDPFLVILDKPAELVSVPPTRTGEATAAELLADLLGPIHPVHRLDHGTSGLMLFARDPETAALLEPLFRRHMVTRSYQAIVHGHPESEDLWRDTIDVRRRPEDRERPVSARTRVERADPLGPVSLLELRPETGRWHQLRLQAALRGHPLVGDRRHGDQEQDRCLRPPRLCLHSYHLALDHPRTGEGLVFTLPLPPDLSDFIGRVSTS